jgi:hypothetical protein
MLKSLHHNTHTPKKTEIQKAESPHSLRIHQTQNIQSTQNTTPRKSRDCTTITWLKGPQNEQNPKEQNQNPHTKKRPPKLPRKPRKHQNTVFELPKVVINVISKKAQPKRNGTKNTGIYTPSLEVHKAARKTPRTTHHHHHLKHPGE